MNQNIEAAIKDIEATISAKQEKDFSAFTRDNLVSEARAAGIQINGKAASKNNTKNELVKALAAYRDENIAALLAEKADLETKLTPTQEQTASNETEIIFDMIDGFRKLETPYLLKIVAPENSSPEAVEIYFKGEKIDTAKNQKAARQKAARREGPMEIPTGYTIEAAKIGDEIVSYTAMYQGETLLKKGGEVATFTTKLSNARGRALKVIARHYKESQEQTNS